LVTRALGPCQQFGKAARICEPHFRAACCRHIIAGLKWRSPRIC
jgi:hypothetical protein